MKKYILLLLMIALIAPAVLFDAVVLPILAQILVPALLLRLVRVLFLLRLVLLFVAAVAVLHADVNFGSVSCLRSCSRSFTN